MIKRKLLKDIVDDLELKLELGDTVYPWEVDDLLEGFSSRVVKLVQQAVDEKTDFGFTEAWDEIKLIRDIQL